MIMMSKCHMQFLLKMIALIVWKKCAYCREFNVLGTAFQNLMSGVHKAPATVCPVGKTALLCAHGRRA